MRWLLALCLVVSGECDARPFTVNDLVRLETYGQVIVAPKPRLVLIERRRAYDTAADYGFGPLTPRLLSNVLATGLSGAPRLSPLFEQSRDSGYWMGSLSPNGSRLSVFRLRKRSLDLGIVDLRTRRVVWLRGHPDLPLASPAPIWLDDNRLLVVTMPNGGLPPILTLENGLTHDLRRLWKQAEAGKRSSETIASSTTSRVPDAATRGLVAIDLRDMKTTSLLDGAIVDVALSPDHGCLAVLTAGAYRRPGAGPIDTSFIARQHNLVLVDLRSGARSVVKNDVLPGFLRWSPDSRRVLAFEPSEDLRSGRFITIGRHADVTVLAREHAPVVTSEQSAVVVHATWQGEGVLAYMDVPGGPRWMRLEPWTPASALPNEAELVGEDASHTFFRAGSRLLRLDQQLRVMTVDSQVRQIGSTSFDPSSIGYRELINPSERPSGWTRGITGGAELVSGNGKPLGLVPLNSDILAFAGDTAVTLDLDARGVGKLAVWADGRSTVVDRINSALRDISLPVARRLDVGGQHHWLFLPATPSRLPLVVIPYPGQRYGLDLPLGVNPSAMAMPTNVQLLTSAGYAVLLPSLPMMQAGAPPTPLVQDVESAVDAAILTGLIDPARVALLGHSFGAYAAMVLATHSNRFKASIASSGPYDLAAAHGSMTGPDRIRLGGGLPFASAAGWAESGQAQMQVPPLAPAIRYVAASPLYTVKQGVSPVLLVHGDLDTVGIDQAEHMFMELARHDVDATLVRYWGEGHVLSSPANIRNYWHRVLSFLHDHLEVSWPIREARPRS